eukprot:4640401-Alexandrium_andersonii.AAC.1
MLGPKASALSAPGAREAGRAQGCLIVPEPARQEVLTAKASRARAVRFDPGVGAEEGQPEEPPAVASNGA